MRTRYKHEPLIDWAAPLPPQPPAPKYEPVKRQPYDSLYLKRKYDRDYFRE